MLIFDYFCQGRAVKGLTKILTEYALMKDQEREKNRVLKLFESEPLAEKALRGMLSLMEDYQASRRLARESAHQRAQLPVTASPHTHPSASSTHIPHANTYVPTPAPSPVRVYGTQQSPRTVAPAQLHVLHPTDASYI